MWIIFQVIDDKRVVVGRAETYPNAVEQIDNMMKLDKELGEENKYLTRRADSVERL